MNRIILRSKTNTTFQDQEKIMDQQQSMETYLVRQKKEWGEILTSFETKNRYVVTNEQGEELMFAAEVGGGFFMRQFLKSLRPFTIQILDTEGTNLLTIKRPFKFFLSKADIFDANNTLLGTIQRRWSWTRRIYSVLDPAGVEKYKLFGPMLHPWTFNILRDGVEIGKITKKWSGLGKEIFTKADNFGITYESGLDPADKDVLLGAVFLIDFAHFEQKNN
ncbi:MAG TPA: scramblase [Phycisphaerae bacterium]|nr:scramblase [Phycisphaerae bacterium]